MIRLILLLLALLLSLLAIFKAPTYHLWLAAIIVTEFPLILLTFTSFVLVSGFWTKSYQTSGTIIGLIALILVLSPVLRAYSIAKDLPNNIASAFGRSAKEETFSFSFWGMINRKNNIEVVPRRFKYISYPDKNLTLDFYSAKASGKKPCIIVVHGGSWKSGDSNQLPELNAYLANAGYHAAAINYRLAPTYQNPLPVADVNAALNYLQKNALTLNIDTNNFILLGRSAGAQIALLAAYTLQQPGIKAVIDFYGPADMVWGYSAPSNPLVMNSRKVMEDYLGGTYTQVPENYKLSSPINFVSKTSVPTLIIHGENDVLVAFEHSLRLRKKLNELGVKHYFLSLPWATHGFDYTLNGPGGQLSTYAVKQFLNQVIN